MVTAARTRIAAVPLAQRVYSRIKPSAAAQRLPQWRPSDALGPAGVPLFVRASGKPLTDGVPGFFTVDGFHKVLLPSLGAAAKSVISESWVLGGRVAFDPNGPQMQALERDVVSLYEVDYAPTWDLMMADMNIPDRDLQNRMPVGEMLEVTLWQRKMWVLRQTVGRLKVVCIAPTRSLLRGDQPQPMTPTEVNKALSQIQTSSNSPTTVVLLSTAGYTMEAHELAERRADRTVILVEPNEAGGWTVTGPVETKALSDLFDPENEDEKRKRVREVIDESKLELLTGGIAVDKVITRTKLPVQVVEAELKAYAKNTPGLVAKRLDGRLVLFREGTVLPPQAASAAGGSAMPLIDRVKALFSRKGESEKKIAFLSERRAALSQQRDRAYEEMGVLEQQESTLKDQFKNAAGSITKRRITSQLLQLRKDLDRRQQLLSVLNQQINVISTHLHNLELVQ